MRILLILALAVPMVAQEAPSPAKSEEPQPTALTDAERLAVAHISNRITSYRSQMAAVRIQLLERIKELEQKAEQQAVDIDNLLQKELAKLEQMKVKLQNEKGAPGCTFRNQVVYGEGATNDPGSGDWNCTKPSAEKPKPTPPTEKAK